MYHSTEETLQRGAEIPTTSRASISRILYELKVCTRSRNIQRGKIIHTQAKESTLSSSTYVVSSLINMYAKCGSMAEARDVFESCPNPDVVCWNSLIQGYVDNDQSETALKLFDGMDRTPGGCVPNDRTYVAALSGCAALASKHPKDTRWLEKGIEVHSRVVTNRCCASVFVQNTLIDMYSRCGRMEQARTVFESMKCKNLVSWNALIHGYAENGEGKVALTLFNAMQHVPDARTYVAALTACATLAAEEDATRWLEKGEEFHSRAVKNGCCNIYVESAAVNMYAEFGDMHRATSVFDRMERKDVVTWTSLLKGYVSSGESERALGLFESMKRPRRKGGGCSPNAWTYVAALTACATLAGEGDGASRSGWIEKGRSIHLQALSSNASSENNNNNIFVQNTLIDMYGKGGEMVEARKVFDSMPRRDVVSWNALLQGYVENAASEQALDLFDGMEKDGVLPDARTFVAALTACASLADERPGERCRWLAKGRTAHSRAKSSHLCDRFLSNALIYMYSRCHCMASAQEVFDELRNRDVVSWNCLVQGYVDSGESELALELVISMRENGLGLNSATFIAAVMACGNLLALERGKFFHAEIGRAGCQDTLVLNCLVDCYGKCGCMELAEVTVDGATCRSHVTWNSLMSGYCLQGDMLRVFEVFHQMKELKLSLDEITFTHLLAACSHAGLTEKGRECFRAMTSGFGVTPNVIHYNCLVDLLGRANLLDEALRLATEEMPMGANVVTWLTLLSACRKWRNVSLGKLVYKSLLELEKNDAAGYSLMANMYGVGMWNEQESFPDDWMKQSEARWSDARGKVHRFVAGQPSRESCTLKLLVSLL